MSRFTSTLAAANTRIRPCTIGIVALQHGIDGEPAEARDVEHGLGDDHARDQQRNADADHRDDRHRGVLQRMQQQHAVGRQALGVGGADIVLLQHLQHRGAGDAGDQRHVGDAERHRRQDQAFGERPQALARSARSPAPAGAAIARRRNRSARRPARTPAWRSPARQTPMTRRSTSLRAFQAATTPIGMASDTATNSVDSVSATRRLDPLGDQPRHRQVGEDRRRRYRPAAAPTARRRTARPSAGRARAWRAPRRSASLVASSPAMIAAGSPGAKRSRKKTNSATTAITGTTANRRRTM